jgi:hypothetical protein
VRRRYVVLLLAAAVAAAAVVPAVGGNGFFGLANHALHVAKKAGKKAKRARGATRKTGKALSQTQAVLNSTKVVSGQEPGTVSTDSQAYVDLGGPSVAVAIPQSGLVDVWARVDIEDNADGGAVALFEDGQLVPGQAQLCDPDIARALLLWEGTSSGDVITVGTPSALIPPGIGCGTLGPPGPVQIQTSPGNHTYELRYADPCPCGSSQFSNRLLRLAPRL